VFACIGDGEAKNGDFRGKMAKLEKVKYGSNARRKPAKAREYWVFVDSRLRGNDIREKSL
jgi:hypothetical protein